MTFSRWHPGRARGVAGSGAAPCLQPVGAVEEQVQVAVRRGLDPDHSVDRSERAGEFLRDRARRLPQAARQREGDRDRDVTERAVGRRLERHLGDGRVVGRKIEEAADGVGDARPYELMNGQNHSKMFRDTIFGRFLISAQPTYHGFFMTLRGGVGLRRPSAVHE